MSTILYDATIRALKEARGHFFAGDRMEYSRKLQVALQAIRTIESLGAEQGTPRALEVLNLEGEYIFIAALPQLNSPARLIESYEAALTALLLPPSKVVGPEEPFLPPTTSLLAFYAPPPGREEQLAQEVEQATVLYRRLTGGGGGGVAILYRAELAWSRGERKRAARLAQIALDQAGGDHWMIPLARRMLSPAAV